ncbi:VOC family protein [Paenibacillus antri]|uniref:Bleomycin resistance protein n=1 Tax=Paenibacillus antri TaxID=2582848 RepID=A0A5R9GFS0_9BACL|nr:glyoxalase superfamily protein [Paenibacillus antri]TLS52228.1 VOC family protein [Paenibacillus antri]
METHSIIPIFRMFDEGKAKQFYVEFLGFQVDWEHRFEPDLPLYLQLSKGAVKIHLSEHYGDCTPGGAIRIETTGLEQYQRELLEKRYPYARPGLESAPWGAKELRLSDPFGNRIVFYEWEVPQS